MIRRLRSWLKERWQGSRLCYLLWEHQRCSLEHRKDVAAAELRTRQNDLLEHDALKPGQEQIPKVVTHRFWKGVER